MKKVILTVALLVAASNVDAFGQTPYNVDEAYQVYAAVLPSEWPASVAKAKKLVIISETSDFRRFPGEKDGSICLVPAEGEETIYGPIITNYLDMNKTKWKLRRKFAESLPPYELVAKSEIEAFFATKGPEGWSDFYKKYPDSGGNISLSAVGFNADKTIALVYIGHSCGGLCGGGRYHVLKKYEGKWTPITWKGMSCSWVS